MSCASTRSAVGLLWGALSQEAVTPSAGSSELQVPEELKMLTLQHCARQGKRNPWMYMTPNSAN